MMSEQTTTSGVQELIDRLSQDGVAEGRRQASQIVDDAKQKADDILDAARQQANDILNQARNAAQQYQTSGEEALKLACRDAVRDLASRIHNGFRERLQELVKHELNEPKLVKRMILEITRKATEGLGEDAGEILLSPDAIQEEEVRRQIEAGEQDALAEFVKGLIGDDLREGFTVSLGNSAQSGMTVRAVNQNIEIDLTDEAITELLAAHLLPRFRAIMRKT